MEGVNINKMTRISSIVEVLNLSPDRANELLANVFEDLILNGDIPGSLDLSVKRAENLEELVYVSTIFGRLIERSKNLKLSYEKMAREWDPKGIHIKKGYLSKEEESKINDILARSKALKDELKKKGL